MWRDASQQERPNQRLNASGIVSERLKGSRRILDNRQAGSRSDRCCASVWWLRTGHSVMQAVRWKIQTRPVRSGSSQHRCPLTKLPRERGQWSAIEGRKRLRKQLLRKEPGAPASINLQPRGTNLVNESRAQAFHWDPPLPALPSFGGQPPTRDSNA